MRVLIGFSGGVDSAAATLLLLEQGHEVTAAMMSVRGHPVPFPSLLGHGCGEKEDVGAAMALADKIGVRLVVVDCARAYQELVLGYFRREYLNGNTPNPCIRCNPLVKFRLLPDMAREQGVRFDFFATGHYARIESDPRHGGKVLMRGTDHGKDQSYFLYRLTREQLDSTLFPLGSLAKSEVRALAAKRGLPVHDKPDSQDFHTGPYAELLGMDAKPGNIVTAAGSVLGHHRGYWNFTPGQRKGLGVPYREPLYVMAVIPETNEVVVGTREEQLRSVCLAEDLHFHSARPEPGTRLLGRMRSAQPPQEVCVEGYTAEGWLTARFTRPQHGMAPGQSLVLYDGETVVGGGIIRRQGVRPESCRSAAKAPPE